MRVLLDTNVLIYDSVEDSPFHEEASRIVDENEIALSDLIIHEFIWVMLKLGAPPLFIREKLKEYLQELNTLLIHGSLSVYSKALKYLETEGISYKRVNDLIIVFTAKEYDLKLATFDKRLASLARRMGIEVL
ncbi:twitching motility protein PilT [Ignicoccus pacificus DSM 13166]|uniref:Ribonuclease VapC n=1 Tax=Ignicoccus pacificus DSM 13166 TaxID=940294 RepID=A0A977K9Z5_9CREN|nr:twitching motility protein PilT [Ignicoccus pacificus DSM 13166]